jgi:hypothetical protein
VKRIDVSSSRVRVLDATGRGAVRAPAGGLGGRLRRIRLRLALALGIALVVAGIAAEVNPV